MREGGTISRLFCERWGEKTRSGAARKALEAMIPNSSEAGIPINVHAAARYVGIEHILDLEASDCDGLLSATSSGTYVASLRKGQSQSRKRFTLAHEIGHLVVFRSIGHANRPVNLGQIGCRTHSPDEKDEERLCDILAAELVMPRTQFLQTMDEAGVSAATLPEIARRFGVSLQAAGRRVAQLIPYEIGIGLWSLSEDAPRFIPKWYLTKNNTISIEYVIEAGQPGSACFTDGAVRGWHWIPLHGQMDKYFVDVCPLPGPRKAWLVLVIFSDAAQQIMAIIGRARPSSTVGQLSVL
jgi:hypothetical protein